MGPESAVTSSPPPTSPAPLPPRRFLPLLLPLLVLLAGCDSGDASPTPTCNASGSLTATVDGETFVADCIYYSFTEGDFTLTGTETPDETGPRVQREVTIVVPDVLAGAFAVGSEAAAAFEDADLDAGTTRLYTGASGEVVVLESSRDNPLGTFSFTASDGSASVAVTEGQFDVYR